MKIFIKAASFVIISCFLFQLVVCDLKALAETAATINFEENGGSDVANITQEVNTTIDGTPVTSRTAFTFEGWYADLELASKVTFPYTVTGDATLYAKWTSNQYTISFHENGGSQVDAITQNYDTTIDTAPTTNKAGYTFEGWYTDLDLTSNAIFPYSVTGNATLYANWTINQYTISFDVNGGSQVDAVTQNYNTTINSAPASSKDGYTFDGWYTDLSCTNIVTFPYSISGDVTLFAKWITKSGFTISFEENGGSNVSDISQENNTTIDTAPVTSKTGYAFEGWFIDTEFSNIVTFPYTVTADATLYAKWTINSYTVSFNANGGTPIDPIEQNYNTTIDTAPITIKTGYNLVGWYTDLEFTNKVIFPYTVTEDITFYAKWNQGLSFINSSYTINIPDSGSTTITVSADGTDKNGDPIDPLTIIYSLKSPYTGITIDSTTGVITVTSQAQAGSVDIVAIYDDLSCTALLNIVNSVSNELTISTSINRIYLVSLSANNISVFDGITYTVTYDPGALLVTDLCAFTNEKEISTGAISGTGIILIGFTPGEIQFTVDKTIPSCNHWSGVLNIFEFLALTSGDAVVGIQ